VDHFIDHEGNQVGYRLSKSIELKEFPSFEISHRLVRAKTLMLHTFKTMSTPGGASTSRLELRSMVRNDFNGKLPAWLVAKMVDAAAFRGACIRDYLEQQQLSSIQFVSSNEMVPLGYVLYNSTKDG